MTAPLFVFITIWECRWMDQGRLKLSRSVDLHREDIPRFRRFVALFLPLIPSILRCLDRCRIDCQWSMMPHFQKITRIQHHLLSRVDGKGLLVHSNISLLMSSESVDPCYLPPRVSSSIVAMPISSATLSTVNDLLSMVIRVPDDNKD